MTFGTMVRIQTVTVPAGGQAAIEFLNIPQTYDDLVVLVSARGSSYDGSSTNQLFLRFNNNSSSYSSVSLAAATTAGSPYSGSNPYGVTNAVWCGEIPSVNQTASTFGNTLIHIPNYTSSNNKSFYVDNVSETNGNADFTWSLSLGANLWSNTSAINQITLFCRFSLNGTFQQHTTATLYGITRVPAGAKATGGVITDTDTHWIHTFTSSGTFTPLQNITCDYLVVAGGGGGNSYGGGGGAGGLRCTVGATGGGGSLESALSLLASTNYTVTVGAGGTRGTDGVDATNGSNSVFSTITSTGGGKGGQPSGTLSIRLANSGGSGGGGQGRDNPGTDGLGGAGTANQGFAGGNGNRANPNVNEPAGGGGGAGAVGGNATTVPGNGGNGVTTSISGTSATYAGGGGGGNWAGTGGTGGAIGGTGGGGNGGTGGATTPGSSGTTNTGGGGGGATWNAAGGSGGSGIVIVRYAK